jgi:hypothetical protein
MKIWKLNDCEWYAAETLDDAKRALLETIGPPAEGQTEAEFFEEFLENPCEVGDEHLDKLKFVDEDKPGEEITFRQELQRMISDGKEFPRFFASTEY